MKDNHIVLTTINFPDLLEDYRINLAKYGNLETTKIWIVGDHKTPANVSNLAVELTDSGLETIYLDIEKQDIWGSKFPGFYQRIPYNNETRRNIGYLHALEEGCQRLISIDDDNWVTEDNFIGGHALTGSAWKGGVLSEEKQFHNVCEHLEFDVKRPIYPRGFPFRLRGTRNQPTFSTPAQPLTIGVTVGLWLREPDVDATTWLNGKILGVDFTGEEHTALEQKTWTPVNTQNTSVTRELIPAYLCIPMGWDVPGGKIQRYGDIWGGYFLQALMAGTNYTVAFGRPLVDHRRNPHDYLDDLRHEFWGMVLTDWLLGLLRYEFHPTDRDICDRVEHLAEFLLTTGIQNLPRWCTEEVRGFLDYTAGNLTTWAKVCRQLR
ncbi:MAG: hypothetical protein WCA35_00620 [Kovacikia sp.]